MAEQTVGSYELLELAGEGAASRVYRARDRRDGRVVALKLLSSPDTAGPRATLRLRREFRAIQRLRHPHIVRVHELGMNGQPWIAMEFIEGRSFLRALDAAPGVPLEPDGIPSLAALLAQVLEALAYVHSRQVLHRDLKPENILVDDTGRAKLLDFGLARLQDVTSDRLTQSGTLLGTPRYVAPEQALGDAPDGRSDLYSLGVIAYEALAGRPPCEGRTLADLLTKRLSEAPPALSSWAPAVPRTLEQFVHRLLEINPEERYASAAEALEALPAAESPPSSASPVSLTGERPLLRPRLVGRVEERAALRNALDQATAGRPRLLLVEGEAGLGKSRLLQELRRMARREGALVLEGTAFEGSSLPYAAFDGIFARLTAALGDERARQARETARALAPALKRVHPGFDSVPGWRALEEPPELEAGEAKRRVFEAISRLLEQLAAQVPVLLILDDLHHCDALSVELIKHLHERLVRRGGEKGLRLLLAVGLRPEECRAQVGVSDWLEARRLEPSGLRAVLAPLGKRSVAALLASMLGERRERLEEAARLHRLTDGNPFFVEETVRSLHEEGQIRYVDEGWSVHLPALAGGSPSGEYTVELLAIPERVRTTLRRRLRPLPNEVLGLLEKASVLGREFDVAMLETLSGDSEEALLDGLDALVREGLLLEAQQSAERLRFRHDLLREVVYAGLSPLRRRRLHARAARIYSSGTGDDAVVALAHHASAADDVPTALTALPRAADRLQELHDSDGARHLLRRYLELETSLAAEARRERSSERHAVLGKVASLELLVGNPAQSEEIARRLVASALEADDRPAESDGRRCLAAALNRQARFDLAQEEADRALEASLAAKDRRREVWCRITRGRNLTELARDKEGIAELRRAERLALRLGDDEGRLSALESLALLVDEDRSNRRKIQRHERCAELAERLDRKEALVSILRRLGLELVTLGDMDSARTNLRRALDMAIEIGDRFMEASLIQDLAYCDYQLGRLSDAEAQHRQAYAMMSDAGEFRPMLLAVICLSDVLMDAGRYDESTELLEGLMADPRLDRVRRERCYPMANLAVIEIQRGRFTQAFDRLQAALEMTLEIGRIDILAAIHQALGRLFLAVADHSRASETIARASQLYRRAGVTRGVAITRLDKGLLSLAQGRVRMAERAFQQAAALADQKSCTMEGLAARIGMARCLATRQADAACEAALECYEETMRLGIRPLAAEAALVLVAAAPPDEAARSLAEALSLAREMGAPPLLLRIHTTALEAGLGDRDEHLREARLALAAIEPHLGEFQASFMSRPELRLLSGGPTEPRRQPRRKRPGRPRRSSGQPNRGE